MILAPHVISGSEDAMRLVRDGKALAVKLVGGFSHAGEYRAAGARIIVARAPTPGDSEWRNYTGDPRAYYEQYIEPHLTHSANRDCDAWETGLNEDNRKGDGEVPDYSDWRRRAAFECVVGACIAHAGKRPVFANPSVGQPSGTPAQQQRAWREYADALTACRLLGGFVGLHAYWSVPGWTGPLDALLVVMREMQLRLPILLTETGVDLPSWKARGMTEVEYARQAIETDNRLRAEYPQVAAAFLFTFGTGGAGEWDNHNLDGAGAFTASLVEHGRATAVTAPLTDDEKPLFSFPGGNQFMRFYSDPICTRLALQKRISWDVEVFERGEFAWRVSRRKQAPLWMRVGM